MRLQTNDAPVLHGQSPRFRYRMLCMSSSKVLGPELSHRIFRSWSMLNPCNDVAQANHSIAMMPLCLGAIASRIPVVTLHSV